MNSDDDDDRPAQIKQIQNTPATIATLIAGLPDAELRRSEADEFSALETVCHLRDLEIEGYGPRLQRLLSETDPELPDFDGARVAAERNYNAQSLSEALQAFQSARETNVKRFDALTEEEWERSGTLQGVGRVTMADLVGMIAEHDRGHLEELRVLLRR